ncbi:Crp/Fnr family transcriptional regulator [Planomicrobium sp. CPCC 101110]|uniref:Crp/Fnr family transcriptional regulator n=1 Tax=Planomicrobium sp. CPCC 101110 TaxID=2599619 RepID=UPI0011B594C1|nr:Crp/Fnr family transcriptional regulator [Planomicrobium sp. CPCC 101110]TWT26009.1 Crp/Fnr family transcriptional regulator [Planomicrobium sp. CPCC 101110]
MDRRITAYLQQFQLSGLFPDLVQQEMFVSTYASGERLFSQSEEAYTLYFLVEGKLKISMLSPEGKRLILAFKTPFDIVGDIEYVRDCPFINTVEAVTDIVVIGISYDVLRNEMSDNAAWLQFLLDTITKKFETKARAMNFNLLYAVDVRVASYLLSMTPTQPMLDSTSLVDMADLIGTSYRHLNRVLQQFEKSGWILKKRGKITLLDRAALLEQAGQNIYE